VSRPAGRDPADAAAAALAELRDTIRDGHGARRDLLAAIKDAKAETAGLAAGAVAERIGAEVDAQLARYTAAVDAAIAQGTANVLAAFDRFGESLLGTETYWATAAGRKATAQRPDADLIPEPEGPSS
jgi:hypothetical protein